MTRPRSVRAGCFFLGIAVLAGCGETGPMEGDDGDELGHPPPEMVATWTFQSVTENGSTASLADVLEWVVGTTQARIHIQANGAYVYEEVNSTGGQLWAESGWIFVDEEGPTIEFHVQADSDGTVDEEFTVTYTLVGNTMTVTRPEGGSTYVFTLGK